MLDKLFLSKLNQIHFICYFKLYNKNKHTHTQGIFYSIKQNILSVESSCLCTFRLYMLTRRTPLSIRSYPYRDWWGAHLELEYKLKSIQKAYLLFLASGLAKTMHMNTNLLKERNKKMMWIKYSKVMLNLKSLYLKS